MPTKISELGAASAYADADLTLMVQSGVTVQSTIGDELDHARDEVRWRAVTATKWTAAPASTSRLTMSDTSDVAVGLPVRYTITGSATYRYGIITALSANAYIDIAGISLSANVTAVWIGLASSVVVEWIFIAGNWETANSSTALATYGFQFRRWRHGAAQIVQFSATHMTADTGGTQPNINVLLGGDAVSSENTAAGPLMGSAGTIVTNSAAGITTANAPLAFDDVIEVLATKGTNGDAQNMTMCIVAVLE